MQHESALYARKPNIILLHAAKYRYIFRTFCLVLTHSLPTPHPGIMIQNRKGERRCAEPPPSANGFMRCFCCGCRSASPHQPLHSRPSPLNRSSSPTAARPDTRRSIRSHPTALPPACRRTISKSMCAQPKTGSSLLCMMRRSPGRQMPKRSTRAVLRGG